MADLGSIGYLSLSNKYRQITLWTDNPKQGYKSIKTTFKPLFPWSRGDTAYHALSTTGTISGTISSGDATVPVYNVTVRLYYEPSGIYLAQTKSNETGSYSFSGLPTGISVFTVVQQGLGGYQSHIFNGVSAV